MRKADPTGMCTFRIGASPDELKVMRPKTAAANSDGSFPCGRITGYESKEFRMPALNCESCFIELEWAIGAKGSQKLHYCADVSVLEPTAMPSIYSAGANKATTAECPGDCANEGECRNGKC